MTHTQPKPQLHKKDLGVQSLFHLYHSASLLFYYICPSHQARDEVITFLKAEKMDLALLEAQYGFLTPVEVLRALQRDSLQAQASEAQVAPQQDVYEKPMVEVSGD